MADDSIANRSANEVSDLKHERTVWSDNFEGPRAALIAAGLVAEGQFPGDPGRGKTMISYRPDGQPLGQGRPRSAGCYQIVRRTKSLFSVSVWPSVEEVERRRRLRDDADCAREAAVAAHAAQRKAAAATAAALQELAVMPDSGKAYARQCADVFWTILCTYVDHHCDEQKPTGTGYAFSEDQRETFLDLGRDLYWAVRRASPTFSEAARLQRLTKARAAEAALNEPLQAFLEHVRVAPPPEAERSPTRRCRVRGFRRGSADRIQRRHA